MNKFLAEQLLEFNQDTNDQYRENWGSILNFVHEDPNFLGYELAHNNSSIDIFQKQMKQKEQQLLDDKAKKEAAKQQSNVTAMATKYHHDQKERLQALVEEARIDNLSPQCLTEMKFIPHDDVIKHKIVELGTKHGTYGDESLSIKTINTRRISQEGTDQDVNDREYGAGTSMIELDKSIHGDISLQQQVSFQADNLPTTSKAPDSGVILEDKEVLNSPKTAENKIRMSEFMKTNRPEDQKSFVPKKQNHLRVTPQHKQSLNHAQQPALNTQNFSSFKQRKSSLKTVQKLFQGNRKQSLAQEQSKQEDRITQGRPSIGNFATTVANQEILKFSKTTSNFCGKFSRVVRHKRNEQRQMTQVDKAPMLSNFDVNNAASDIYQDLKKLKTTQEFSTSNQQQPQKLQYQSTSQFLQSEDRPTADGDIALESPSLIEEPINLGSLQSLNLRNQLMQRLNNFNQKSRMEKRGAEEVEFDSNRFYSTNESFFQGNERSTILGRIPPRHPQVYSQCQPRRPSRQFIKTHGKDLASSQYMQSMMQIREELVEQKGYRSVLMEANQKASNSTYSHGAGTNDQRMLQTDKTANFGQEADNQMRDVTARKASQMAPVSTPPFNGDDKLHSNSRFGSQMRQQRYSQIDEWTPTAAEQEILNSTKKGSISKQSRKSPSNFNRFQLQQSQPYTQRPSDSTQTYIHQNHLKMVIKNVPIRNRVPCKTTSQIYPQSPMKILDLSLPARHGSEISIGLATTQHRRNQVPLPNQSNAFFASGGNMIDPTGGDLEYIYSQGKGHELRKDTSMLQRITQHYKQGKPAIDRTNQMLKRLQMQTPGININREKIRSITSNSKNKVSYVYKDKYCGIYEDKRRQGQLKKENSWDKFVNPPKVGLNNHLQQAFNNVASDQDMKQKQQQEDLDKDQKKAQGTSQLMDSQRSQQVSQNGGWDQQLARLPAKTDFRNDLQRFHYQFDQEYIENINDDTTFDRTQKANKRFDSVIQRAKPSIKLYNLLGYSRQQYILFRQIQHWMRNHKLSDKKQTDNINNIQFAREFFAIIDESDSGAANLQQLAVPMIALGLSSDSSFIKKVMKAISPHKFGKKAKNAQTAFEDNYLTLKEFIKIFKKDQVSENLTEMLRTRIIERREKEFVEKKRAMMRRTQQLSIVQDKAFTVTKLDTEEELQDIKISTQQAKYNMNNVCQFDTRNTLPDDSSEMDLVRADTGKKSSLFDYQQGRQNQLSQIKEVKAEQTEHDLLKSLASISINDMLLEVRRLWFQLDEERGLLELDLIPVCQLLCSLKVMQDISSAQKYIRTTIQSKKAKILDYDDFNSIFCKGIFRYSIVSKAQEIEQETALNPDANPEEKLEFKMARTKNQNLTNEIRKGRIERSDEAAVFVLRPILTELWQIFYKNVPREHRETYEEFFNRMQGLTNEIIQDPASVELDAFSKIHAAKVPGPPRTAMSLVAEENKEMAINQSIDSPYKDQEGDQQTQQSAEKQISASQVNVARRSSTTKPQTNQKKINSSRHNTTRSTLAKDGESFHTKSSRRQASIAQNAKREKDAARFESKSQMSNVTGKQLNETAIGNLSTHRTEASSTYKIFGSNSGAKFAAEPMSTFGNMDLKMSEDIEELIMQRKQRFESLRQLQGLMTRTDFEKPPGFDYLQKFVKR